MAKRESHHEHFIHFDVAGFTYYDGCMVIGELRPGMRLMLERDTDNTHDAQAIAIYFGDKKLGYVPSNMNATLAQLLDFGYGDIFEAYVQRVAADAHPEHQLSVIVYLKRKTEPNCAESKREAEAKQKRKSGPNELLTNENEEYYGHCKH